MKKYILLFIAITSILIPCKLHAVDISVGASSWYAWYKPSGGAKVDPAFLFSPALSVKFNDDYNLTFVYYYGKFDYDYGRTSTRHDSDLALNYRLNNFLKVFAGVKYRRITADSNEKSTPPPPVPLYSIKTDSIGPGVGLSGTFPVIENMYLIATGSGLFLFRRSEYDLGFGVSDKRYYHNYGYNTTLSIAYYIAPLSTVINLGGRYQCFIDRKDTSIRDSFYGITLTATYSFDI